MTTRAAKLAPMRVATIASEPVEEAVAAVASPAEIGADAEDGPRWPDEVAEASFLAEQKSTGSGAVSHAPGGTGAAKEAEGDLESVPLPALNSLVERIPAAARETLDELFRARFMTVKRVAKDVLK